MKSILMKSLVNDHSIQVSVTNLIFREFCILYTHFRLIFSQQREQTILFEKNFPIFNFLDAKYKLRHEFNKSYLLHKELEKKIGYTQHNEIVLGEDANRVETRVKVKSLRARN